MSDDRERVITAVHDYLKKLPVDRDCGCDLGRRWPRFVAQLLDTIRMTP